MDRAFMKQASEWFDRGRNDIETAQLLYDNNGHADSIAYHIQQTLEKYLKGYLVLHGKNPPHIHELDVLINRITVFDDSFVKFLDLCEKASRYYLQDRYPPGPLVEYDYEDIKSDLEKAWEMIRYIQTKMVTS
jgi:HEPN domain-containing protein